MRKKSQITIFIIIGILLLLSVFLMFYYLNYSIQEPIEPDTNTQNQHIIGFIEGCVDQKAKQSLFYLGFIGGDTKIKKLSTKSAA